MVDIFDELVKELEEPTENTPTVKGIIVRRYMLEITEYPDGKSYERIFKIGKFVKNGIKKKNKPKDASLVEIQTEETV